MASQERQKVKFTGNRTGLEAIGLAGYGIVKVGDTIEVDADVAERWTEKLPMADDKMGSDFTKMGGSYKVKDEDVDAHEQKQREKLQENADEYVPDVPLAHEVNDETGTVEDQADSWREADAQK